MISKWAHDWILALYRFQLLFALDSPPFWWGGGRLVLFCTQGQIFYFSFKTSNLSTFVGLLGFLWLAFNIRITWRPQPKRLVHFLSRKYQCWLTQMNRGFTCFASPETWTLGPTLAALSFLSRWWWFSAFKICSALYRQHSHGLSEEVSFKIRGHRMSFLHVK